MRRVFGHGGRPVEAILIAGATASGKSALALRLAERFGGTIINADSMQVYRDLRVLTARPTASDEARVPHRLYGHVDGADAFSVSRWLAASSRAIADAHSIGSLPILVGGTGLYFKVLTQGLSDIPPVPDDVRAEVRARAAREPPQALHALLAQRDPLTAGRLRPSDPQRIVRALEVVLATGRTLSSFQRRRQPAVLAIDACVALALALDRATLRDRVASRFGEMMERGGLAEVDALGRRGLSTDLPVMRALGVPPLMRCMRGEIALEVATAQAVADSHRYLKRQDTFLRHQLDGFRPVEPNGAEDFAAAQLL